MHYQLRARRDMHYNVLQKKVVAYCHDEEKVLSKIFGVGAGQFFQWLVELIGTAALHRGKTGAFIFS